MEKSRLEELFDEEYKIENITKDFEKDSKIPDTAKGLSSYNLNKGFLLNKWISKYSRTSMRVKELETEKNVLENKIKQKCRYDKDFNENRVIDKNEMLEKIYIDEEYQKLQFSLARLKTIQELILFYVEHFKFLNQQISNQIEIIKLETSAY